MTDTDTFFAGLAFLPSHQPDLHGFCRVVAGTLADYGHIVERQSILSANQARITTRSYAVELSMAPADSEPAALMVPGSATVPTDAHAEPQGARLEITLIPADPRGTDIAQSQLVLLVMVYRMIEAHGARHVEWLDRTTVLPAGRFMSAFSHVSPRRVHGRQEILDANDPATDGANAMVVHHGPRHGDQPDSVIDGSHVMSDLPPDQALSLAFRSDQQDERDAINAGDAAESDIRRLAAWGMTGVVTMISGPVGLSLAAVNLLRGEDFRLNTQVLALTGFLGVATTGSAMADVLSLLPL